MSSSLNWYIVKQKENSKKWISYSLPNPPFDSEVYKGKFKKTTLIPVCKYVPFF